ncbi:MAG TPA: hypothetical protein VGJ72_05705, partial [Polaromonas sp.]
MTTLNQLISSQLNPTASQASMIALGMAASQTAYALNNGGGLVVGQPLTLIEDSALIGAPGARPLGASIPPGYVVRGIYTDSTTGLDAYMAYDPTSKSVVVGIAGTNGFGKDKPDTAEDLLRLGVGHMEQLLSDPGFRSQFNALALEAGGVGSLTKVLFAGQSLAGGAAPIGAAMALYGVVDGSGQQTRAGLGLHPDQLASLEVNGFGTEYTLKMAGYSPQQITEFNAQVEQHSVVVYNQMTGMEDVVSKLGGSRGGFVWGLPVVQSNTLAELHRNNYGVAEGNALLGGDLTQMQAYHLQSLDHGSLSDSIYKLSGMVPLANNAVSLTWAGYVGMLLSKPGESAAGISYVLKTFVNVPPPLADVLGAVGEVMLRALPLANLPRALALLAGGYGLGQTIGSSGAQEPSFTPIQDGWTRQNLTPAGTEAYSQGWRMVMDVNPVTGVRVLRMGDGSTQEYTKDGAVIYSQPQYGLGVFQKDGSGTLYLKGIDPVTGAATLSQVSVEKDASVQMIPGGGWRVTRPLDEDGRAAEISDYAGNTVIQYTGAYRLVEQPGGGQKSVFDISATATKVLSPSAVGPIATGLTWSVTETALGAGHTLTVMRDDDRRVVQSVEAVTLASGAMKYSFLSPTG